jgi:hypothetical protein
MKTLALCCTVGCVLLLPAAALLAQPYRFTTLAGLAGASGSANGTNAAARFAYPYGLAGSSNALFVADTGNHTIRKLTLVGTNWVSSTIAGLAGTSSSADGTNANARFYYPFSLAVDGAGRLYVADTYNYTIRRITPVGTNWVVSTLAGLAGAQGTANGSNSVARFTYPQGVAVDSATNVYVTDGSAIRRVSPIGTNWAVTRLAGVAGTSGSDDGTNAAALFYYPFGLAVDSGHNLYVADMGNDTIRKVAPVGANWVVSTIAGLPGAAGSADAANSAARFYFPAGVALDGLGNLFVSDYGNQTIRKLTLAGANWVASTLGGSAGLAGSADGTNGVARFNLPLGIAVDSAGNTVYVADSDNHTIRQGLNLRTLTCTPPPTNLVSWWRGEGNAFDSAGTNNATLVNGASFAAGEVGLGFSLSGGGDYVALPQNIFPYPTSGSGTKPFTFEVWFSTTTGGVILGQQSASSPTGAYVPALYVGTDGLLYAALFWNNFVRLTNSTAVNDGRFHHVAVTFNGTTEVLYLDGAAVASTPFTQLGYAANYQYQLGTGYAGGWPATDLFGWYYFDGIIDEASIYSRALTAGEVATLFNAGSSGKCTAGTGTAPLILAQPANLAVPLASTATFTVSATGTSPMTYTWCKEACPMTEGGNVSNTCTPMLCVANSCPTDEGHYSVIIRNAVGGVTSKVATLKVLLPPVFTTQPTSCTPTVGDKAEFSAPANGTAPLSYGWQFNGIDMANGHRFHGVTTPTLRLARVELPNAGYYRLIVTNAAGAATSTVACLQVMTPEGRLVSPPVPDLNIASHAGQVRLSWPADIGAGFQLQGRRVWGGEWQNVTNEPALANGFYQVTVPATSAPTLYRLKQ